VFSLPRSDTAFRHSFLAVLFLLFFLLVYGGSSALSGFIPYSMSVDFSFEKNIPYVPLAAPVYVSLNLMLLMAPLLLRTWQQMWMLFSVLIMETLIAAFFFIVMPVEATPTIEQDGGLLAAIYSFAEFMNFERNEFPSLHVAFTVSAALAYRYVHGVFAAWVFGTWSIAILASTVFMKEHYVLDVIGGMALGFFVWQYGHRRFSTDKWLSSVDAELIAVREMLTFSMRHRRYATIMISIYAASLFGWRKKRILRTGFSTLQWIDDLLDFDRHTTTPPLLTAHRAIEQIRGAKADESRLGRLITYMCEDLDDEGQLLVIQLIENMCEDNRRITEKNS